MKNLLMKYQISKKQAQICALLLMTLVYTIIILFCYLWVDAVASKHIVLISLVGLVAGFSSFSGGLAGLIGAIVGAIVGAVAVAAALIGAGVGVVVDKYYIKHIPKHLQ